MRYQIVCQKNCDFPTVIWKNNKNNAITIAKQYTKVGYRVNIWEHTKKGSKKMEGEL